MNTHTIFKFCICVRVGKHVSNMQSLGIRKCIRIICVQLLMLSHQIPELASFFFIYLPSSCLPVFIFNTLLYI